MKKALLMNFQVNKENKNINVEREFDAPVDLVWATWTQSELLDKWWAPKPWKSRTKVMDFKEGGYWQYAMVGPEGEEHWGRADYKTITPKKFFSCIDGFCDEQGKINKDLPQNLWENNFTDKSGTTLVSIRLTFDSFNDLEKIIEMGFKEGFIAALENLDEVLNIQK
jgi:uncharacterized protein YndB with AHSA1/START domain